VNALDVAILLAALLAVVGGYRLGLVARVLSWAGLGIALALAVAFVPSLMSAMTNATPRGRLLGVLGFVLGIGLLGQALGLAVGSLLHASLPLGIGVRKLDKVAGAVIGGFGVLVFVWLLIPALASAPGWPARAARGSAVVRAIDQFAPDPPASIRELGRMVAEPAYQDVLGQLNTPDNPGDPPTRGLSTAVGRRVAASVVKVEGRACDQIQDGSGWVVRNDLVVTNAHVVAGERRTSIQRPDGSDVDAVVVAFDPRRDLALLRAPGLGLASLQTASGSTGLEGAVYGHPGGGPLRSVPARIAEEIRARGPDIYRTSETEREVYVLAAQLQPGDSGGPLVDRKGRVVGVAFAIDPRENATAYALTDDELDPLLRKVGTSPVTTGSCLVG
jgi:S1-C subfamily serine protease